MNLLNVSKRINKISLLNTTSSIYRNTTNIIINKQTLFSSSTTTSINNQQNTFSINELNKNYYSTYRNSNNSKNNNNNNNNKRGKPIFKTYSERHKQVQKNEFTEYGLSKELIESIKENNWEKPTQIQQEVIPMIFKGRNVVFSSVTGSGKTAAYSLPFIQILSTFKRNKLNYLKKQENNNDDDSYELFNKEDQGNQSDQDIIIEQREEEKKDNKLIIKSEIQDENDLKDDYFEIEDEFDEDGNHIPSKSSKESIEFYERLQKLKNRSVKKPFNEIDPIGIILLPSKELVMQVGKEINQLCKNIVIEESDRQDGKKLRIQTIMGGLGESKQIESLKNGVDIIIGTPGKIIKLINQDILSLQQVRMTVIDEFDKLFNLGFFPDIKEIFDFLPKVRSRTKPFSMQTVLTSATLTHKLDKLITRFSPNHLIANQNSELSAPSTVKQYFFSVNYRQKTHLLLYFLRRGGKTSLKNVKSLVFARTQQRVEKIAKTLQDSKINALSIHADMSIAQRNEILNKFKEFKEGEGCVLVCTDVMTRGVHIDGLDAVVNFDVPHVSEDYLHRIGRAGRSGNQGFSLTFVSPDRLIFKIGERTVGLDETHLIKNIENSTGIIGKISKIPGPWRGLEEGKHETGQGSIISKRIERNNLNYHEDDNIIDDEDLLNDNEDEGDYFEDQEIEEDDDDQDEEPQQKQSKNGVNSINIGSNRQERYQNKQEKKAVAEILIKKKILEPYRGPQSKTGLPRVKFNPNAKIRDAKISKIIVDRKGEIHELPNLTDFKEGQYHQVLDDFDRKRATKRGINFPTKKTHVFLPSKIETKRAIKNVEKNPTRYNNGSQKKKDSNSYDV